MKMVSKSLCSREIDWDKGLGQGAGSPVPFSTLFKLMESFI